MSDYYEILGVSEDATMDEIKKKYKKLAVKYHPDKNKESNARDKFQQISDAYKVLGDEESRYNYDTFGPDIDDMLNDGPNVYGGPDSNNVLGQEFYDAMDSFDDIFNTPFFTQNEHGMKETTTNVNNFGKMHGFENLDSFTSNIIRDPSGFVNDILNTYLPSGSNMSGQNQSQSHSQSQSQSQSMPNKTNKPSKSNKSSRSTKPSKSSRSTRSRMPGVPGKPESTKSSHSSQSSYTSETTETTETTKDGKTYKTETTSTNKNGKQRPVPIKMENPKML